jgi:hypothetical protein
VYLIKMDVARRCPLIGFAVDLCSRYPSVWNTLKIGNTRLGDQQASASNLLEVMGTAGRSMPGSWGAEENFHLKSVSNECGEGR